MKKQTKAIKLEGYNKVLKDIRFLLDKAKAQTYKAVDNIRVQTYWQIGERIVREGLQHKERADYGKRLIEKIPNCNHTAETIKLDALVKVKNDKRNYHNNL